MTPYLIVFASFLALYFALETASGGRTLALTDRWVLLLPLAAFAIVYAGRIGADADSYGLLFDLAEDFPLEPGFSLLMIGAKSIGLDYIGFTEVLAVVQMLLLASIVRRLRDPLFFLLFYVSSFFLNFQFNEIRNSLALLIIAALYVRVQRPGVLALLSSSVIHYSSPFTLGLQRLAVSKRQLIAISAFAIGAGLVAALWLRPGLAGDRLDGIFIYQDYLEQEYETKAVYPALLLKLAIVWLLYRNGGNSFYLAAYAMLVVIVHLVSPVLSRVSDLVLFLTLLDFCMRQRLQRHRFVAIALTMILVLSSLLIPWNDCQNGGADNWCIAGDGPQKR
jgi:hypothetical protein